MKYCPNCSAQLSDDAQFCSGCGAQLNAFAQSAAPAAPFVEPPQPTMDSVAVPIISDDSFAPQEPQAVQPPVADMGYQQGFQQPQDFQQAQWQQPQQFAQPQQFVQPQQPQFDPQGFTHQLNELNNSGYQQSGFDPQTYAQAPVEPGYSQPGQPMNTETPDYINPASPQMPGTIPGKSGSSLIVPIILIILIIGVILVDIFWLFRKQIFGDDSSSTAAATSIVTMAEEQPSAPEF